MTTNHHTLISTGGSCPATLHNTSMISVPPKTQRTTVRPFSRQLIKEHFEHHENASLSSNKQLKVPGRATAQLGSEQMAAQIVEMVH